MIKQQTKHFRLAFIVLVFLMCWVYLCYARPTTSQPAPSFILQDISGTSYNLSQMTDTNLIILYFFDAESRPSQEGLLNLDQIRKQHKDADLTVLGITLSSREKTEKFLNLQRPQSTR